MEKKQTPLPIFVSYVDKDRPLFQELENHLSTLKQNRVITTWNHRKIVGGAYRAKVIDGQLRRASIILILMSADYLTRLESEKHEQVAVERIQKQQDVGNVRIIPIIIRFCDWKNTPFGPLQYLPRNGEPISGPANEDRDAAWTEVVNDIRLVIEDMSSRGTSQTEVSFDTHSSIASREEAQEEKQSSTITQGAQTTYPISRRAVIILGGLVVGGGAIATLTWFTRPPGVKAPSPSSHPIPTIYRGHSSQVYAVAWFPRGGVVASGGLDTIVQVWATADGRNIFTYHGHSSEVHTVAWSPDGKLIASGGSDHTVQVWDHSNHAFTYHGHSDVVHTVAWSPDGKLIASGGSDHTVQVWNVHSNHVFTYHGHSDVVWSVAWSPDGKLIASASSDNTVQVWDASTGSHSFTYTGHPDTVRSVAWSPNGQRLASGSHDKTVQVWDASTGYLQFTYTRHSARVHSVAWSPDGRRLASAGADKTVQVWDASTGYLQFTYTRHSDTVESIAWSPDSKQLASASYDHTVQVWMAV